MPDPTQPHIAIIGEMSVGKTTIGRALAARLGRPFLDSDEILLDRVGSTGAVVAEREGVAALHRLEIEILVDMSRMPSPAVIAPAASVVDDPLGSEVLQSMEVIWLTAPEAAIDARQGTGPHRREISAGERARLRSSREPLMANLADIIVDTGAMSVDEVVGHVERSLS
jgi:shikimate kinase